MPRVGMRQCMALVLALGALGLANTARANGGISFIAGRYYFDLSYGKASLAKDQTAPTYEFYRETRLSGSTIWKAHFRSIHRIEFPSEAEALESLSSPAEKAEVVWSPSRTRILASFGEWAFILDPDFNLQWAFRNTEGARWLNDDEIEASVETAQPRKYDRGLFAISVAEDRYRRIK